MAFFTTKKDGLPQNVIKTSNDPISSVISKDMLVTGEVRFKGKARIDGTVEGNIQGEHLIVSESAKIIGDLELISLICHGVVEGNIKAQQVTTHCTATIHGNLVASNLTVESGTRLNGEITASSQQEQPKSKFSPGTEQKKSESRLETPSGIDETVKNQKG